MATGVVDQMITTLRNAAGTDMVLPFFIVKSYCCEIRLLHKNAPKQKGRSLVDLRPLVLKFV